VGGGQPEVEDKPDRWGPAVGGGERDARWEGGWAGWWTEKGKGLRPKKEKASWAGLEREKEREEERVLIFKHFANFYKLLFAENSHKSQCNQHECIKHFLFYFI
jgi:hypothetical protein